MLSVTAPLGPVAWLSKTQLFGSVGWKAGCSCPWRGESKLTHSSTCKSQVWTAMERAEKQTIHFSKLHSPIYPYQPLNEYCMVIPSRIYV